MRQSALSFFQSQGSGVSMAWGSSYLPFQGNAIKLSGRTFLAPHRGSCPEGLCKRTGFLGVKRRENPVRRHFERSEMRGQHYGISNIVRWPLACPYCLRHFPRRGNAVKLSKILIAHASNSVCFFHPLSLLVNNKIKKLVK